MQGSNNNEKNSVEPAYSRIRPVLPRELSDGEIELFRSIAKIRTASERELIFRKGELGRSMFIIESGRIQLEFGDGLPDKIIGAKEFFGELALFIGNHTRVASASAVEPTQLRIIDHGAFEQILEQEPKIMAHFMRRSFAYLVASEQRLIANLRRRNEDLMVTLDSLRQTQTELTSVQRLLRTDELTGLFNRRGLYDFLERLNEIQVPQRKLALLLIDIDRFKQINDQFGHLIGDQVLNAIANEVQSATTSDDLPCRLGGDEFALLAQVENEAEIFQRAEQIVTGVNRLRFAGDLSHLRVSVSVGGGMCLGGRKEWSNWYSEADLALYEMKGQGGDMWKIVGAANSNRDLLKE